MRVEFETTLGCCRLRNSLDVFVPNRNGKAKFRITATYTVQSNVTASCGEIASNTA